MRHLIVNLVCLVFAAGGMVACGQDVGVKLDAPRIVALQVDPPAVVPPAAVTATVKLYDPQFRNPTIQWYLSLTPPRAELAVLQQDLSDLAQIQDPDDTLIYVGSGTQVSSLVPTIPKERLPAEDIFDTFPLWLLVSVKVPGEAEFKGFKQLRVILPELVENVLQRQLEDAGESRSPTTAEIAAAIAVRRNRNPVMNDLRLQAVAPDGEYTSDMVMDLLKRREAPVQDVPFATVSGARAGLRLLPRIVDPDLADNPAPGEPGYNKIELDVLSTEGRFYPLSLTEFDWVPFEFSQGGLFSSNKFEGGPHPLVTVQATVFDRQGGVGNMGFEIDNGEPPRAEHRGSAGSMLFAEGRRMQWIKIDQANLLDNLETGMAVEISAAVAATPNLPHGIEVTLTQATATTAPETGWLNRMDADPAFRHHDLPAQMRWRGHVVRLWTP